MSLLSNDISSSMISKRTAEWAVRSDLQRMSMVPRTHSSGMKLTPSASLQAGLDPASILMGRMPLFWCWINARCKSSTLRVRRSALPPKPVVMPKDRTYQHSCTKRILQRDWGFSPCTHSYHKENGHPQDVELGSLRSCWHASWRQICL